MGAWMALSAAGRAAVVLVGGAVVAGSVWVANRPAVIAQAPDTAPAALLSEPSVAAPAEGPAAAPMAEAPLAQPQPPIILTWAVTQTGTATIAGTAEAGAALRILVDEALVAEAKATPSGEFAVVTTLAPNPAPSLLKIVMVLPDGREIAAKDVVALAPIAGPKAALPLAEPAPDPTAELAAAEPAPEAVMLTDAGAVVLHPGAVAATGTSLPVSIQTITYLPDGPVQIGGTATPGLTLRLYLDGNLAGETGVPEAGQWLMTLQDVAPGLYTMRADAVDAAGKVTARFETPFRRESLATLAAASHPPAEATPNTAGESNVALAVTDAAPLPGGDSPAAPVTDTTSSAAGVLVTAEPAAMAPPQESGGQEGGATAAPTADPAAISSVDPSRPDLPAPPGAVTITVQPGHTLWAIARGELGDGLAYVQVYEANRDKIVNPDLIYPGQVVTIPGR